MRHRSLLVLSVLAACTTAALAQTPKTFPPPARTGWRPLGCRVASPPNAVLASRAAWRSLHSDEGNTDAVSIAYAPVFHADWVAEPSTWNPTGPVFDSAGNLYVVPFNPHEAVALISLDPQDGSRRWTVPNLNGIPVGSGTPMVLEDPEHAGEEIVYLGLYDRALAVRTDGTMVWDVPTGLGGSATGVFGVNYHPGADAIVGLTRDGFVYALDRRTGAPVLAAPFQLPGEPSPPGPPSTTPPSILACAQAELEQLADLRGSTISDVINILLGNDAEVSNYFSIDAATGRLWVGATAPDAEDGAVDGRSALGALYRLELVPNGPLWAVTEACHRSFVGGTASTPALRRDGTRVYVGDNVGNLLAVDESCNEIWSLPVGGQITGSVGVSDDNDEVYASTSRSIHQVIDHGTSASLGWTANLDVFDLLPGQQVFNQDLAGIGANAIAFQAGAGVTLNGTPLSNTTGVGLLDRQTGAVRAFAGGLEETVAVMSTGPDGALYLGNSPLRRLFSYCLGQIGIISPVPAAAIGGIRKWAKTRPDLELRESVCAADDRTRNAVKNRRRCPASFAADQVQLGELLAQSVRALAAATGEGSIRTVAKARLDKRFANAAARLATGKLAKGTFRSACSIVVREVGP